MMNLPIGRPLTTLRRVAAGLALTTCCIGCGAAQPAAEIEKLPLADIWTVNPDNPIVEVGDLIDKGLWNDPSVTRLDDGRLAIYMTSSTEKPFEPPVLPFRVVSSDGINWTLDPKTPLLRPGDTPYVSLETPSVVRFKGQWHMYYMGVMPQGSVPGSHIGHAVSDDGVSWRLDPKGVEVVSATGDVTDWNGFLVSEPGAVVYGDRIYLYFCAVGARPGGSPPQKVTIGLATSRDGSSFTEPRMVLEQNDAMFPPQQGYVGYATVSATAHEGRMHLFYNVTANLQGTGSDIAQVALHHAVSDDGVGGWRQDPNVIFTRETHAWTRGGGVIGPTVLFEDGKVRMWFAGHTDKNNFGALYFGGFKGPAFGIGYAEAPLRAFVGGPKAD